MAVSPKSVGSSAGDASTLLRAWSKGDQNALDRLIPIVYDELHRLARRHMRGERPGHSVQTTALVNEAYIRLAGYKRMKWQDRAHFFAVSAQVMRRILVEHARRHNRRRGGGLHHVSLEEAAEVLKVSAVTVKRDWRVAKAWLYHELTGGSANGPATMETS